MVERVAQILRDEQRAGYRDTTLAEGLSRWLEGNLGDPPPDIAAALRRLSK